jgi:uncharacterized membrane protein
MIVVLPLHILATIILFGSLFLLCVGLQPSAGPTEAAIALSFWHRILTRFFVWGSLCMVLILITGIAIVFLEFGGPAGIPTIHRANMMIGIPAIALFGYLYLVPWKHFRRAVAHNDWTGAEKSIRRIRITMAVILVLGLIASAVSVVGRYYV